MATAKGKKIADYAESKLGCAYIWGGYGEKLCSPAFRRERAEAYPSQKDNIYRYCQVLNGQKTICNGCRYYGKQAYDCAQLTRYACKAGGQALVSGANSQWKRTAWAKNGTIDTLPDEPGVILYHANAQGVMTHTGVCVGNGYVIVGLDMPAKVLLTKEWLYTAITRAKKYCVVCGEDKAIRYAIATSHVPYKQTMLRGMLQEEFAKDEP